MDKIIKFNSIQGGPFTATQNLVDFHIPMQDNDVYDLSKSYLNVISEIITTGTNTFNVYNAMALSGTAGAPQVYSPYNSSLVKNFNVSCAKYGRLSDVRRVDILSQTLNEYLLTEEEKKSGEYASINNGSNHKDLYSSPWREMRSDGTILSRNIDHAIKIPLNQLDGIGDVEDLCGKVGNLDFHFELNVDKFTPAAYQGAGTRDAHFGQEANTIFNDHDATAALEPWTTLTTTALFDTLDDSPYFVGQQLSLTATSGGTTPPAVATVLFQITGIEWLRTTDGADIAGALKLTVTGLPDSVAADNTFTDITCDGVSPTSIDLVFNKAELVLVKKHPSTVEDCDGMAWNRWSTEQDNGNALQSFSKQYVVEPSANTLFVVFPDATETISNNVNISDVLMRVDNVDLTNRIVKVASPLYYDRLNMSLMNIGKGLNSLVEMNYNILNDDVDEAYALAANSLVMFANPLPITNSTKLLQLNINCSGGTGVNKIILYKSSQYELLFK